MSLKSAYATRATVAIMMDDVKIMLSFGPEGTVRGYKTQEYFTKRVHLAISAITLANAIFSDGNDRFHCPVLGGGFILHS